jgi:hypothetical protein
MQPRREPDRVAIGVANSGPTLATLVGRGIAGLSDLYTDTRLAVSAASPDSVDDSRSLPLTSATLPERGARRCA